MTVEVHDAAADTVMDDSIHGCQRAGRPLPVNVGATERLVGAAVGTGLVLFGLAQARRSTVLSLLVGGGLLYRSLTGHCTVYKQLGVCSNGDE